MDALGLGRVTVSDGGLATALEARGHDLSDPLWSARLLLDDPAAIAEVHTAFFEAGAQIATTATYQASFDALAARGLDRAASVRLLHRGVELARAARDEAGGGWVAASVGPFGAARADGSEYRGRYGLSAAELARWHRPRLEALAEAGPDLLALETIPDATEAEALVGLVAELGLPAWLSYTASGGRTRAGQPLAEAFAVAAGVDQIVAVGVNCCSPDEVPDAVRAVRAVTGKPAVAYPNSGEGWDVRSRSWTGPSRFDPSRAADWVGAGASVVGGCCRVGPAGIAALSRTVAG